MACTRANVTQFTNELAQRKNQCAIQLTEHEQTTPDVIWQPQNGEGREPFSTGDTAKFKLVTEVTVNDKDKIIWPPKFTRLSDELVYLATKFLKVTDRAANYPYDFNERGDIREERIPSGVSPIVWAHGLPFFPVFKGYYILCGREHARWVGWLLNKKEHKITKTYPMWTIGPVVAPGSAVNLPRTVNRQMHLHVPKSAKDVERKWEKHDTARDVVSKAHYLLSVVPKTPSKGFILTPIYRIEGYHVRCGPKTVASKGLEIGRRTLSDHGVNDFDYDASLKKTYANEENPAAFFSDSSDEASEEDSQATELMSGVEDDEDSRGDEAFVPPSEESAEVGDIVEEPPRKKLKKDVATSDKAVQASESFIATSAVNRLTSFMASVGDEETNKLFESFTGSQAINRRAETATTVTVEHVTETENITSSAIAEDVRKDAATQATFAVSGSEAITSTADTKTALPEKTPVHDTEDTTMADVGLVPPTNTPSSAQKDSDETATHYTKDIQPSAIRKALHEKAAHGANNPQSTAVNDGVFHSAQNTQIDADAESDLPPREVTGLPDTDFFED